MKEPPRPKEVTEAQALYLKNNPACAISGIVGASQAHHKIPYEYLVKIDREWLASDQRIFISLSETEKNKPEPNFHLLAGHLGSFLSMNIHIDEDIAFFKQFKTTAEIEASVGYLARKAVRYKRADEMTDQDIKDLQAFVDAKYPRRIS